MGQQEVDEINRTAWEYRSYEAWVAAYGTPAAAAQSLVNNPERKLKKLLPFVENIDNANIAVPLGSHGRVAVSLALLGAKVTVFDISASNKKYAIELANSAGVSIGYEPGGFIDKAKQHTRHYDYLIMELGVLHYFCELDEFVASLGRLLKPGGVMLLHEFHPLLKKAIDVNGSAVTISGDYFRSNLESAETPYSSFLDNEVVPECRIRRWNLGEVVTAFANGGFRIISLVEEPSIQLPELPGTYTVTARLG